MKTSLLVLALSIFMLVGCSHSKDVKRFPADEGNETLEIEDDSLHCKGNEAAGIRLISNAISDQLVGTAIHDTYFTTRIYAKTESQSILSLGGIVKHGDKYVSIHGLLVCDELTDEYEFGGAGVSKPGQK